MSTQIKNRFTGAVMRESAKETLGEAVMEWVAEQRAMGQRPILNGASLDGASLDGASLDGASLDGASLDGASLNGASLDGASLDGASLDGASLNRASLDGASLNRASLDDASLDGASLNRASLDGASLDGASLNRAYGVPGQADPPEPYSRKGAESTAERIARYRKHYPDVPVVENLDRKILDAIEAGGRLEMNHWHTCETTHCRAGWAITLAGDDGRRLEKEHGPQRAGSLIYRVSSGRMPHFFATNERALEDIKACAARAETAAPSQE